MKNDIEAMACSHAHALRDAAEWLRASGSEDMACRAERLADEIVTRYGTREEP